MQTTTISTITGASTTGTAAWNGGYCPTCGAQYLGSHACTRDDILRRISELSRLAEALPRPVAIRTAPWDRMSTCPCRPENGGSGVCGCVLSGPTVTC